MFANQRQTIYKLFVTYMKRKRDRREYDAADRYESLLSRSCTGAEERMQYARLAQGSGAIWPAWTTNRFSVCISVSISLLYLTVVISYIDEAQDNLLIDALGRIVACRRQAHV